MDSVQTLASALGLGFLAGIRLYGTVLAVGIAVRFGWIHLPESLSQLHVLADTRVLAISTVGFLAEFFADKIPWVDSTWDAIHTFIRPVGAALLATAAMWHADPATQLAVALLSGGVAFAGHSSKAATRFAVNHSPEPLSNVALSLAGDLALPVGVWIWATHPYVLLGVVLVFLAVFAWLAPKVLRFLRVEWVAVSSRLRSAPAPPPSPIGESASDNLHRVLTYLRAREIAVPEPLAEAVARKLGWRPAAAYRTAAASGLDAARGSVGYLCIGSAAFAFVTRRWGRLRIEGIGYACIREARLERHFLADELILNLASRIVSFDVFKPRVRRGYDEISGAPNRVSLHSRTGG